MWVGCVLWHMVDSGFSLTLVFFFLVQWFGRAPAREVIVLLFWLLFSYLMLMH